MKAATAQVRAVTMQANRLRKTEKQCVSVCYTHPRTGLINAKFHEPLNSQALPSARVLPAFRALRRSTRCDMVPT